MKGQDNRANTKHYFHFLKSATFTYSICPCSPHEDVRKTQGIGVNWLKTFFGGRGGRGGKIDHGY